MFDTKVLEKKIKKHILCSIYSPSPTKKNRAVYELMCKNVVQPDRQQMTIQYVTENTHLHAGWLRQEYRNTFLIFHTYCFPKATTVPRMRLNITLYVQ